MGTWSFASNTEKAWHGLGQIVDKAMTSEEAIKLANLDYEVAKAPLTSSIVGDEGITLHQPFENLYATYRKDSFANLGIVSNRYEIVQNKDAFTFFDSIIDKGEAIFETAGALGDGERIFVMAKLPQDFKVAGEDCNKYILLTNSHDGSSSIIAGFTSVRVVCSNTLTAALKGGLTNKVSIRHNQNAKDKLAEAYKVMGLASVYMNEVDGIFNQMAKTTLVDADLKKYIARVMATPEIEVLDKDEYSTRFNNLVDGVYNFALSHPTQQTDATRGTVWGGYNAISGYFNYCKNYKNQEEKFKSQMFGTASNKTQKGFAEAVAML